MISYTKIILTNDAHRFAIRINKTPSSGRDGSKNPSNKMRFKEIFTPIEINCIIVNRSAFSSALRRAIGIDAMASIQTIAPNKTMYSLCPSYSMKLARFVLKYSNPK